MNDLRRQIIIKTASHEEEYRIAEKIHNQLAGNEDYVECRIVLNMSADRKITDKDDDTENEVHVYIFNDSKTDPEITI